VPNWELVSFPGQVDQFYQVLLLKPRIAAHRIDGDDSGHGGFRSGAYVFRKVSNAGGRRLVDENISTFPAPMEVMKVLM